MLLILGAFRLWQLPLAAQVLTHKVMQPHEPSVRLGTIRLPWYRHMIVEVPYTRWHLLLYLGCVGGLGLLLGTSLICALGIVLGGQDPLLLAGTALGLLLPVWNRVFSYGHAHWHFAAIESASQHPDALSRWASQWPEVQEAQRLLDRIAEPDLEPAQRQQLRLALKAVLNELARSCPPEIWEPLHAQAPYLTVERY
ncbi:MAG: hypothetical protein E1N59_1052 [Puniceicoccaceae bacterium 5H]|nr:MAG: hypothetical protein E1N59_1052 [Puniceicoccaceae bacterium 5H]